MSSVHSYFQLNEQQKTRKLPVYQPPPHWKSVSESAEVMNCFTSELFPEPFRGMGFGSSVNVFVFTVQSAAL
jgi:hypothetical protein